VEQARADVAHARSLVEEIKRAFYDLGVVLKRLRDSGAAQALGYRTFAEMCKGELQLSGSTASDLIRIVESVGRNVALGLGQSQVLALVKLCEATPEDDTVEEIVRKGNVRLPSGKVLDVPGSSVRDKREATKEVREAASGGKRNTKGSSTSAEDRRVAAEAEAALQAVGLKRASVRAVARPGKVGDLRIEGIPTSEMRLLCKALCGARRK